jgi:hypothetical protein
VPQSAKLVVLDTSALTEGVFFADFDWHLLGMEPRYGGNRQ